MPRASRARGIIYIESKWSKLGESSVASSRPGFVHILTSEDLSLLEQDHGSPRGLIDGVYEATRLNAEAGTLGVGGGSIDGGDIDVLARVELECRLGAVHLQMDPGAGAAELGLSANGQTTSIERDFGRVGLHDEDVVDMGAGGLELEGLGHIAGELGNPALWNPGGVEGQIVVSLELGGGAGNSGAIPDVEVAISVDDEFWE